MSAETLKDVYADELKDLWSANSQMAKAVAVMIEKATDPGLKDALKKSAADISKHSDAIKSLLSDADEEVEKDHCKGMEGLVKEASKHIGKHAPESGQLLDIVILAQYRRMSHYGLAGFGTAAAYAKALDMEEHGAKLGKIIADIDKGDQFASALAAHAEELAAAEDLEA